MRKLLRSKRGVTLTELIVAMLVFSILLLTASAVFSPMLRVYYQTVDFAETNPLLDEISNVMLADINEATQITVTGGVLEVTRKRAGFAAYTVQFLFDNNGFLCRSVNGTSVPVYDPQYYRGLFSRGKTVRVTYTDRADAPLSGSVTGAFYIRVAVVDSGTGNESVTRRYAANPLCLS